MDIMKPIHDRIYRAVGESSSLVMDRERIVGKLPDLWTFNKLCELYLIPLYGGSEKQDLLCEEIAEFLELFIADGGEITDNDTKIGKDLILDLVEAYKIINNKIELF